jgi:hypothetical protein
MSASRADPERRPERAAFLLRAIKDETTAIAHFRLGNGGPLVILQKDHT